MKRLLPLYALIALPVFAADPAPKTGTLIDFRVEIQKSVANDLGRATAFSEISGADSADVANKVKNAIADGLASAKSQAGITVKSGSTNTYPVYGKNGRSIESWRMRSEIFLESRDAAALSAAAGKLQNTLAISGINFSPAPETRRKAEDDATLEAIEAFTAKASRIASAMKKNYRIRQITIGSSGNYPAPRIMYRAAATEAAPMPVEAGESNVAINVSGQIELLD